MNFNVNVYIGTLWKSKHIYIQSNYNYYLYLGIRIDEFSYFLDLVYVFASDLANFLSDCGDYLVDSKV